VTYKDIAQRVASGDARAVARLITGLENEDPEAEAAMRAMARSGGRAEVIGITGPPGSGKSTLADKMIGVFRSRGLKVGVVAVDPSSPFSGGAILGDRLRMQGHATDPGVFIRSLSSRGRLGGLSSATRGAVRVLDAAGYDVIIVETVGVGQSEVDVVRVADTVILVAVPGLGDDIQVIKAGIMEIGDIFAVNKADRPGADRVVREIRGMLEMAEALRHDAIPERATVDTLLGRPGAEGLGPSAHHALESRNAPGDAVAGGDADAGGSFDAVGSFVPPVIKTVAETGEGVEALVDAAIAHRAAAAASGALDERRLAGTRAELRRLLERRVYAALEELDGGGAEKGKAAAVLRGEEDEYAAAEELFAAIVKGERR
jgi:LAO/AO transport system kinase